MSVGGFSRGRRSTVKDRRYSDQRL